MIHIKLPNAIPRFQRARELTIEDLNYIVKRKIFTFLEPSERQILRQVCKSWFEVINESYGIRAYIDNANIELIYTSPWIIEAYITTLTRPIQPDRISFAERVTEIEFKKLIVHYNLFPILQKCIHLQILTFVDPEFDLSEQMMKSIIPRNMKLKELLGLNFECWTFTESLSTITKLLAYIQFGKLRYITFQSNQPPILPLEFIFSPDYDERNERINPLITLVRKHIRTLRRFLFGKTNAPNKLLFYLGSYKHGGVAQLEELQLERLYPRWASLLTYQHRLKTLIILNCEQHHWADIKTFIRRCGALKRIVIEGRTFGTPWDCEVFENSVGLRELTLNISLCSKRRFELLPKYLTRLEINAPFAASELYKILEMTNLQQLQFNSLGLNVFLNPFTHNISPETLNIDDTPKMTLRQFVKIFRLLLNLQVLTFKNCTADGLEWAKINEWIAEEAAMPYTLVADIENHYYDTRINGRRIQHGFTLKINPNFDRMYVDVPGGRGPIDLYELRRGLCGDLMDYLAIGRRETIEEKH